jgi:16S rRNA (adenine1518-N6/adenine1519-N6)-dimethyltransferase
MPRRLGQHFLANAAWRERILAALPARADETWVEIGAGHGEMTRLIAPRVRRLVAIELDPRLLRSLERLAEELGNVEVHAGDVLEADFAALAAGEPLRVYGNLPYYITSPILRRLFAEGDALRRLWVVIQLEVAARITARPGRREYGFLSVLAQYYASPHIALRIPSGAFRPPPKVASALVALDPPGARQRLGVADEAKFLEFVGKCFAQKRKALRANLRAALGAPRGEAALATAGIAGSRRAEELTLEEFAALFAAAQ